MVKKIEENERERESHKRRKSIGNFQILYQNYVFLDLEVRFQWNIKVDKLKLL